nr:hypothetical protein [Tanacetum cinerariifolium]
ARESSRLFIALFTSRPTGGVDTCLHLSLLGRLGLILCFLLSRDMVTHTIDTVASVLTRQKFDHFCNTYNISADLRPELPGREDTIRDAPLSVLGAAKDPLPFDNRVNAELLALLDHHQSVIRPLGLSRSFDDVLVRPTLLKDDESDMDLLDFVKSSDPFKVKTRERTLAEGEIPLNDETLNMTTVPSTGGKSPTALKRLELQSGPQGAGSGSAPPATEEFVSSSISPTPEPNAPEDFGFAQDGGVRTYRASMRVVVSSSFWDDDEVAPTRVEDPVADSASGAGVLGDNVEVSTSMPDAVSPINDFYDSRTVETATADNIYVPDWGVTNGARVDNPALCYNCVVVEQRDAEIAALTAWLEKAEREAAEQNAELLSKVSILDSECGELNRHVIKLGGDCERLRKEVVSETKLREEFKSFQDDEARRFEQKSVELDARIADIRRDMDNDLYPHMFTTMAGRRWILSHGIRLAEGLEVGIEHGKSGRTLAQVEAYDPGVKDDFVSAVTDFENVSFGLLDQLESLTDSPLASIISALVLKDAQESGSISGEVLLSKVVPTARAAAKRRGLCPRLVSGTSSSAHPHGSLLGAAAHPVSTFVLPSDGGPVTQPPVT